MKINFEFKQKYRQSKKGNEQCKKREKKNTRDCNIHRKNDVLFTLTAGTIT